MAPAAPQHKDVYNPLLFEIAWEVANKGLFAETFFRVYNAIMLTNAIISSWRYLHCD